MDFKRTSRMASSGSLFWIISCVFLSLAYAEMNDPDLKLCFNTTTGETGLCMIAQICDHVAHGVHIGNCVDRLFVLSCCKISKPGRSGKPNTNITHTYNTVTSNSYADSNKTAETAKENFPEVEPLDEILNAPSIGSLNWKPESSDIRIINTSANDDIVSEQQFNQQKVPVNEQIMKDYLTLLLAYYEHLYRLQLNTTENKNGTKSHNNTKIPIQKTSSENSDNGPTFNHHASINFRPYVINNHAQPSPTQGINADTSQSGTEIISSWLKNYLKNNFKTNINAKPITPLIPQKLNNESSALSSTISSSNSTNNESESLLKVNISATSYSLLNENTLPSSSKIPSNVSLNSTKLSDINFSVSTAKPISFKPVSSPSDTTLLPSDVTTSSAVYVSTNISSKSSLDVSTPNSISATESLYEASLSNTLNLSVNEATLSDITHSFEETFKLESIASAIKNIIKYYYKHKTNITQLNKHMPHQLNNESSVPSSPSISINNEYDSFNKANISATSYSLLNGDTPSPDTSTITSNVLFNSTNLPDVYFGGSSSETESSPSETSLLQTDIIAPSPVYVSTNKSVPSWNVELSDDSSVPPSNVSPSMSMNNEYDSLNKVNISAMSYSLLNIDTSSPHTSPSTSNLLFNSTNLSDLYFWGSSSKPTSFESVSSLSDSTLLQSDVTAPSPVYVSTNISAPSWDDKFIDDSIVPSSTLSPSNSINNEYDSQNKVTISDTSQYFLNEDTSSPDTSSSTSNVLFNSTNLSDLYFWGSSSKPTASSSSPPDTTLLQSDLSTPSPVYVSTDISAPSWDVKLKNDSSLSSSTASHSIKNESDSLNKENISATSYSLLNKDTTFPDNLESISVDSTNLLELPSVVSPTKASIFEAVHSFSETKPDVVEPNSPSTLYIFKDSNMPSFNLTQLLKYFVLKSSWKLSILEPVSNLSDTPPLPEGIIAPVLNYVIYDNKLSENNSSSISINNSTDILLESSISNTLHSLRNETKSYDNLDSASNLSLNITKHLDPDILISSSKPTVSEPVSSIINTAPLPNKSFTPFVILVLRLSGALSSTSSVSYYNSIRPDATVSEGQSLIQRRSMMG